MPEDTAPGPMPFDVELVPLDQLHLDPSNPRVGDVESIMASFQEFGQDQPVVARRANGQIVKGNHRFKAAERLNWPNIYVLWVDDDEVTAVRRGIADNRTSDLSYFDDQKLAALLQNIGDVPVPGFSAEYTQQLLDNAFLGDDYGGDGEGSSAGAGGSDDDDDINTTPPDADDAEDDGEMVKFIATLAPEERNELVRVINRIKDDESAVFTTGQALVHLCSLYGE